MLEICVTKAPMPTENPYKVEQKYQNSTKMFDNTTLVFLFRTVNR